MRHRARFIIVAAVAAIASCKDTTAPQNEIAGCYLLTVARDDWETSRIRLLPNLPAFDAAAKTAGPFSVAPDPDNGDPKLNGVWYYIASSPDSLRMLTGGDVSWSGYDFVFVRSNMLRPAIYPAADWMGRASFVNEVGPGWTAPASILRVSCSS